MQDGGRSNRGVGEEGRDIAEVDLVVRKRWEKKVRKKERMRE